MDSVCVGGQGWGKGWVGAVVIVVSVLFFMKYSFMFNAEEDILTTLHDPRLTFEIRGY